MRGGRWQSQGRSLRADRKRRRPYQRHFCPAGREGRGGLGEDRQARDRRGGRRDRHHHAAGEEVTQKLALITGGLHRVGAAISARLAREGYALAIPKRSPGEADRVLADALAETDRKSVVEGQGVAVRLEFGGRRFTTKQNTQITKQK